MNLKYCFIILCLAASAYGDVDRGHGRDEDKVQLLPLWRPQLCESNNGSSSSRMTPVADENVATHSRCQEAEWPIQYRSWIQVASIVYLDWPLLTYVTFSDLSLYDWTDKDYATKTSTYVNLLKNPERYTGVIRFQSGLSTLTHLLILCVPDMPFRLFWSSGTTCLASYW